MSEELKVTLAKAKEENTQLNKELGRLMEELKQQRRRLKKSIMERSFKNV